MRLDFEGDFLELGIVGLILITMAELGFWIYVSRMCLKLIRREKDESK